MKIKISIILLGVLLFTANLTFAQTYQFENGNWLMNNKFVTQTSGASTIPDLTGFS
jgi:hypothetical protein